MTNLREFLRAAMPLAERLARLSETMIDDRVVDLLRLMLDNDPLWEFLTSLIEGVPSPVLQAGATDPVATLSTAGVAVNAPPTEVRLAAQRAGWNWATVVELLPELLKLVAVLRLLIG